MYPTKYSVFLCDRPHWLMADSAAWSVMLAITPVWIGLEGK